MCALPAPVYVRMTVRKFVVNLPNTFENCFSLRCIKCWNHSKNCRKNKRPKETAEQNIEFPFILNTMKIRSLRKWYKLHKQQNELYKLFKERKNIPVLSRLFLNLGNNFWNWICMSKQKSTVTQLLARRFLLTAYDKIAAYWWESSRITTEIP